MRRFFAGLVIVALLQPFAAHATTANSLSGRIVIDGVLNDYAVDEWVLDSTSSIPESDRDSSWGRDNDIARVALTWDRTYLYIGIEARTLDSFLALFISNRAGGLTTLENAGEFRRAIVLPGSANVLAFARPGSVPDVARADDSHPFGLVDNGAVHVAVSGVTTGPVGFEVALPWSMLILSRPVALVAAITGDVGTGAGDAAPDASTAQDAGRFARAVLDRWFQVDADKDHDGLADIGIAPRTAGSVLPVTTPPGTRADDPVGLHVSTRAFAPDRGETVHLEWSVRSATPVLMTMTVYSLEGERVRTLFAQRAVSSGGEPSVAVTGSDSWDGRDDAGHVVRGGAYVVVVDWGYNRGEHAGRLKTAVVVAR